jgi:hypothetical protein
MDDGLAIVVPAISRMTRGKALISTFVISRNASHELLLLMERSGTNFREKMTSRLTSQDGHRAATANNCDISVIRFTERKGQIAITLHFHCGLPTNLSHERKEIFVRITEKCHPQVVVG